MIRPSRGLRPVSLVPFLLAGLCVACPHAARGSAPIIASRLTPSSLAAQYGRAVPLRPGALPGTFVIPTRTGIEIRDGATGTLYGTFRTAGRVEEVACSGNTAYVIAGERGIVAVDVSDSTNPVAIGGHDHAGVLRRGAFAPLGGMLAAAGDSALHFLRETSPGALTLVSSRRYTDGRAVVAVRARSDSFLVVARRSVPTPRMFVTLYRSRVGAMPESLWEYQANGLQPEDASWPDAMAFLAIGNAGLLPFDTSTRLPGSSLFLRGGTFARAIDASATNVVAVGESRTYGQYTRTGSKGETLTGELDRVTAIEPFHVSVVGGMAVLSEDESIPPLEPEESGESLIELYDITAPAQPGTRQTTGTGRARRAAWSAGLVYLADYTGGLRIYRGSSSDSSLVGVYPTIGNARIFDVAVDPVRRRAYLAAGTGGLVVLDVSDPQNPASLFTTGLPGFASCLALVDTTYVVVGRRGQAVSGVTIVDVSNPLAPPISRGSVNYPAVIDARAIAVKDTIAFVADDFLGLLSVRFGNPDAPATLGPSSGFGSRDLDLSGSLLVVGTKSSGVQLVDVFRANAPSLLGTFPTPPVFGVTQQGQTAVAFLGDDGAVAIDVRNPSAPLSRGPIAVPGFARDGGWVGDSLWIAESFGLERYRASAVVSVDPALSITYDAEAVAPRVQIVWYQAPPAGAIGWNLYRDRGSPSQGYPGAPGAAWGFRVNDELLSPLVRAQIDDGIAPGVTYRYRLEAFFPNGSSQKVAEGSIFIPSNSALGRVYPNPYRPRNGLVLRIPYRVLSNDAGKSIEVHVYDPCGREVRNIQSVAPAGGGFSAVTWDGLDDRGRLLADGIYFIHMKGPGIDEARQVVLLR